VRFVLCHHVKCVPKSRLRRVFAQVRAVPNTVCKNRRRQSSQVRILDLPPKTAGQARCANRARRRGGAVPDTAGAACTDAKPGRPPAARHLVTSQDARTPGLARRCQGGGEPQDQVAVPNTCQRILPCEGSCGRAACERRWAVGARAAVVLSLMRLAHRVIMSRWLVRAAENGLCTSSLPNIRFSRDQAVTPRERRCAS
jgi:hypothetical protein